MSCMLLYVFLLLLFSSTVASQSIIKTLPGYPGTLPFKLETGYISVGENNEAQLFYYFIESERNPLKDPLVLWITGGPGCSGLSGLAYEIGPLTFNISSYNEVGLPSFLLNQHSWTKVASVIFLDQPAETGFSYSTSESYPSSDKKSTKFTYMFLRKWLMNHPTFIRNSFYVAGDSYGGKIVPMVAWEIHEGNEAGLAPRIALQGYSVGNPITDEGKDFNERVPFAHRMALISDEYFQLAKDNCQGDYVNHDTSNLQCLEALQIIGECTKDINCNHVLESDCASSPTVDIIRKCLPVVDDAVNLLLPSEQKELTCRRRNYIIADVWANDPFAQEALQIRQGTITKWTRCNRSLSYQFDVVSAFEYHQLLNQKGYQVLVYSGDHDFTVPYMSTLKWVKNLDLTIEEDWRPWNVDGQVAGYTMKYKNGGRDLVFATVKADEIQMPGTKTMRVEVIQLQSTIQRNVLSCLKDGYLKIHYRDNLKICITVLIFPHLYLVQMFCSFEENHKTYCCPTILNVEPRSDRVFNSNV